MAYDFRLAIDCSAPHELADRWAEALGWTVEPQDEPLVRRMVEACTPPRSTPCAIAAPWSGSR